MEKLTVRGGRPLGGTVRVSGSKNAALPLIFATVLTESVCVIENVPRIRDVEISLEILSSMGAQVRWEKRGSLAICTENMRLAAPPEHLVCSLRASTYLMGAMLGRFGRAYVQNFGGCNFSPRPIDMHLFAAKALGADLENNDILAPHGLRGAVIAFDKVSVGATVNALLMAVRAEGRTVIENAAAEPHVENLIVFLRSMGAAISRLGSALVVDGSDLRGGRAAVVGDMIEGGTYLLSGLATGGTVSVEGCDAVHLSSFLSILRRGGAFVKTEGGRITVSGRLIAPIMLKTAPYPGFPTDLQPQTALIGALHNGAVVTETVFPGRFGYLEALSDMGLSYVRSGSGAYLFPSRLYAGSVMAEDLRGGAALVLAALSAEGESVIYGISAVLRGYENIVEKFSSLGANINF
ncbi:MAG: UDP-N-acetylglucosamine 1-carboxyvinyltransferase [Clostridia bacterium]|nr:UDP-N-acetylglucosamine 1-carboxyvinyltransferase [Clostridia bacterium]